jgi:hypothetical protein
MEEEEEREDDDDDDDDDDIELFLGGRSDGNPEENLVTGIFIFQSQAEPGFQSS